MGYHNMKMLDASRINIRSHSVSLIDLLNSVESLQKFNDYISTTSNQTKTEIIESLLIRIPSPTIWRIMKCSDEQCVIFDGYKFIETILEFVNDKFELSDMIFNDLNGCKFSDLHVAFQRRIKETSINVHDISYHTPEEIKQYLFNLLH